MVIEYVENGQIMYYDPATLRFTSRRTGFSILLSSLSGGVLPEPIAKKYLYEIVQGLKYCALHLSRSVLVHIHRVVHRDIKPENILITKDDHCKISSCFLVFFLHPHIVDFGVAHLFETLTASEQSSGHFSTLF